jgi:glycosyltransferase involved in cell wall biosynthesis
MKKKVAIIARGLTKGGVTRFLLNVLRELNKINSQEFSFVVIHNEEDLRGKWSHIEEYYFPIKNKLVFDYFVSLNCLRKIKADLVIYPKNVIPLSHFLLRSRKINIIHDLAYFEKDLHAYPFFDTLFMKTFLKISCQLADKIFSVSQFTKDDIIKRFNIDPEKIVVIHEGVEEKFKKVNDKEKLNKTIEKYRLKLPFLFYSGSISPRKNLLRTLKAFEKVKDKIPHHLYITGQNNWNQNEEINYIQNKLKDRVLILGHVGDEDLVNLYNLADLYLYPSLYEGFGLPILEAQACGCPVLTSNITSCPEVGGKSVFCINPYSVKEIASSIIYLTNNKKVKEELIKKGYKNIKNFNWEKTANNILSILRER